MASTRKLKVYRTAIGFHDAYVAAPSQKAALEAWGSDSNLFARGVAEIVTDPALGKAPLAQPGIVLKRLRGTAAEQLAALPEDKPRRRGSPSHTPAASAQRPRAHAKKPPSRTMLEAAEDALSDFEKRRADQDKAFAARQAGLDRERRESDRRNARQAAQLTKARDREAEAYARATRDWRP